MPLIMQTVLGCGYIIKIYKLKSVQSDPNGKLSKCVIFPDFLLFEIFLNLN